MIGAFPGARITKSRPAVMLSTEVYHRHRPDAVIGLITTQLPQPIASTDCELLDWGQAGLRAPSCFRLYLVTPLQSDLRVIGSLSDRDWRNVLACLRAG